MSMTARKSRGTAPAEPIEPPAHLSERAAALWRDVVPSRCASLGRRTLLQTALEALDRADECRETLAREGLIDAGGEGSKMGHIHALAALELRTRAQFAQLWDKLGLSFDPKTDGRGGVFGPGM